MFNSCDFSDEANFMVKSYFSMTGCLVVALPIAFASERRTDPAHADRKKAPLFQ